MEWVQDFYEKQDQWAGVCHREIGPEHREQAMRVHTLCEGRPSRILDLGCGGGQSAAAIAELGHHVFAVDFNRSGLKHARKLASGFQGRMTVIQGDFYHVEFDEPFDVVCYFDGFGVGEDTDQERLLSRIARWLTPSGTALIDVYTPWYWARAHGQEMLWDDVARRYAFDADECRALDTWWPTDGSSEPITQSLRCYSPADLRLLLRGSGLELRDRIPGGSVDYETEAYCDHVPLEEAMSYLAILGKRPAFRD